MPSVNFRMLLVTDRHQTHGRSLPTVLTEAVKGGVPAIQLRERDLPTCELFSLAQEIHACMKPYAVSLMINDRIDVALALNLAGVHLRANSLPVTVARRLLGPHRFVGISTHSMEEVRQANEDGADYIVFGPIFETPSKRSFGPPLGLDALALACRISQAPVFAIGGITVQHVREVYRRGAMGIAVIGAILSRDDVFAASNELSAELKQKTTYTGLQDASSRLLSS